MGKILSCCSRSSTTQSTEIYRLQKSPSTETHFSEPSPSSHDGSASLKIPRSNSLQQGSLGRNSVVNERAKCNAKLECLIVPSFGKHPPRNVVMKKVSSDFLKGVGDDFKIIQRYIDKDYQKELVNVTLMCHFEQVKVVKFTKIIEDRMNDIRLRNADDGQKGCKYIIDSLTNNFYL